MSVVVEVDPPALPPAWERLERAGREAAAALDAWRQRALASEAELDRLHRELERTATEAAGAEEEGELQRLRAENAALRSRIAHAHDRVQVLLARLPPLEGAR